MVINSNEGASSYSQTNFPLHYDCWELTLDINHCKATEQTKQCLQDYLLSPMSSYSVHTSIDGRPRLKPRWRSSAASSLLDAGLQELDPDKQGQPTGSKSMNILDVLRVNSLFVMPDTSCAQDMPDFMACRDTYEGGEVFSMSLQRQGRCL